MFVGCNNSYHLTGFLVQISALCDEWESLSEVTMENMVKSLAINGLIENFFFQNSFFVEETELAEGS